MVKLDPVLLLILSDLFVNLSAAWFGAAFIVPISLRRKKVKLGVLLLNILFAIISLIVAYILRRA